MAEADLILEQRVEALEQTERLRVVEQVADLSERVARIESAWETVIPHLATKADIVRLETKLEAQSEQFNSKLEAQSEQLNSKLEAQSEQLNSKLEAQSGQFDGKLEALSEQLQRKFEQRMNQQIIWIIGTGIALATFIANRLPS